MNETGQDLLGSESAAERAEGARPLLHTYEGFMNAVADGGMHKTQYRDVLAMSAFTLAPAGSTADTYRVWEALQTGSIPIIRVDAADAPGPPGLPPRRRNAQGVVVTSVVDGRDGVRFGPGKGRAVTGWDPLLPHRNGNGNGNGNGKGKGGSGGGLASMTGHPPLPFVTDWKQAGDVLAALAAMGREELDQYQAEVGQWWEAVQAHHRALFREQVMG